ncbi:MAG: ABC transporter permease [Acidobacteria bacterium]|nr:ABC transporter permease [Acidobacteriota bacterium]
MKKIETVKIGFASLWSHKLRSFLTLLGLIIGVATLITVITIVEGANAYVQNKVIALGTDSFQVTKTPPVVTDLDELFDALRYKDLTMEDIDAIKRGCPDCLDVGAEVATTGHVKYGSQSLTDIAIRGVTANMGEIGSTEIAQGRYILPWEEQHAVNACVLGAEVADKLFPGIDPLGKTVKISQLPYVVVGVAEKIGSILGQEQDNFVIIPITQYFKVFGYHNTLPNLTITARAISPERLQAAQDQARLVLRTHRHVAYQEKDNFYITTAETLMSLWNDINSAFFIAFILIASLASIVGGIVIMNIMLVTVAERTREIGLRKSIGARRHDIQEQFFLEALTLCLMGGLIGIGIGFAGAFLINRYTPFPAVVQPKAVLVGLLVSMSIGLVFGIYPARRAAMLDPVEALRRE